MTFLVLVLVFSVPFLIHAVWRKLNKKKFYYVHFYVKIVLFIRIIQIYNLDGLPCCISLTHS